MPCLRREHDGRNVFTKDKFIAVRAVKKEIKMMFGMPLRNTLHGFIGEPADPLQLVF